MTEGLFVVGVVGGSFLLGLILGWMVSRLHLGFLLGSAPALAAPSVILMLMMGPTPVALGLGLCGTIPSVVGCGLGFFAFRNPET